MSRHTNHCQWTLLGAFLVGAGCAGNVNDNLEEARRGDPESVKEAVITIGMLLQRKEQAGYPYDEGDLAAIDYLREVAEKSSDAVNRAIAVDSLGRLKRPDLTELLIRRLEDSSWLVQIEAAKALARRPDPPTAEPLRQTLEKELRMEVRLEILKALEAVGGEVALRALLSAFLDNSARYQNLKLVTYEGVRKLSGKNFTFDQTASWRRYFQERFPESKKEDTKTSATPRPPGRPPSREGE